MVGLICLVLLVVCDDWKIGNNNVVYYSIVKFM